MQDDLNDSKHINVINTIYENFSMNEWMIFQQSDKTIFQLISNENHVYI